jgi:hypothetical protein
VAIYAFQEFSGHSKITSLDEPKIVCFGPYITSHARHFLQQSEYTSAVKYTDGKWHYVSHSSVFTTHNNDTKQDRLWKFTLPSSERDSVLTILESYNLNAYSLFNNEEALLRTIAVREIDLRK